MVCDGRERARAVPEAGRRRVAAAVRRASSRRRRRGEGGATPRPARVGVGVMGWLPFRGVGETFRGVLDRGRDPFR
jgi:hypothetical protein